MLRRLVARELRRQLIHRILSKIPPVSFPNLHQRYEALSAVLLKGFARLSPGCRAFGEARLRLFRSLKLEKDFTFAIGGISIVGLQVDGLLVGSQGLLRALRRDTPHGNGGKLTSTHN
jgi:hypothetical protein